MFEKINEPTTCKYSMTGFTVDTDSPLELVFDFEDGYGYPHHVTGTALALIKESLHTLAWDEFVLAHNQYADSHECYVNTRIEVLTLMRTENKASYPKSRDLLAAYELASLEDSSNAASRWTARELWLNNLRSDFNDHDETFELDDVYALCSKWFDVEERTFYSDPR